MTNIIDASMWTWKTCFIARNSFPHIFSIFLFQIPTCLQEFEGIVYSATCWLDEAQSWLSAPCCFTTARNLQNHANSLQVRHAKQTEAYSEDLDFFFLPFNLFFNLYLGFSFLFIFHPDKHHLCLRLLIISDFWSWSAAGAGWLWEDQKCPTGLQSSPGWDLCCVRHELAAGEARTQRQTSPQNAMQNLKATGASAGGSGGKNLRNLFWQIVCDPISRIYSFCFLLSIFF